MRVELNLSEEVLNNVEQLAKANNHSRKSYMEFVIISHVQNAFEKGDGSVGKKIKPTVRKSKKG